MSVFIAVLKCILCCEDDEERYHALHRDIESHGVSRSNASLTSQYNYGQTTRSSRAHNDSYHSQAKFTSVLNREAIDARDAVFGTCASKKPSIPNRESINLSGNRTVNSINSSTDSGNNKDARVDTQFPLPSNLLKPPFITPKPSISSVSEKPSEIYQKVKWLGSSYSTEAEKSGSVGKSDRLSSSFGESDPRKPPPKSDPPKAPPKSDPPKPPPKSDPPKTPPKSDPPKPPPKSQKPPPLSTKPTISPAPSSSWSSQGKNKYIWVEKDASSTYVFPQEIKILIEKEVVPSVLKMPLSKSSYKDYFHALLYAEDCYLEKWDGFEMKDVKVQLDDAEIYRRSKNRNLKEGEDKDEKVFVAFELEKIREKRPFLISRDFVSLAPTKLKAKTFQGVIYRVVKSNRVLAEFGEEFHFHHHPNEIYDVKFSFNRVCLKRAHQAVAAASECLFKNLLFPNVPPKLGPSRELFPGYKCQKEALAVHQILRLQGLPPYLVQGPLAVQKEYLSKTVQKEYLSKTGTVVVEAILGLLRAHPSKKILLCAPVNRTCDLLMRGLKKGIAESELFRANAAFRELDGVPVDILPSCSYEDDMECFSCPSLKELKKYKVISTTFMSSFRLYGEGIKAGHFSHIFLVDASSATEPETMVPLANFITEETIVVVTGETGNRSGWIRSNIARENGLRTSYFERLLDSNMYWDADPRVMVDLEDTERYN